MKLALVLTLGAGCFSKPGFTPAGDGDSCMIPPNTTVGLMSADRRIVWPTLDGAPVLEFADETQTVPMPDLLSIDGLNLLPTRAGCTVEDQLGVAIYPMFSTGAAGAGGPFSAKGLTKIVDGAAYASWRVSWQHQMQCGLPAQNPTSGESRFSMFPDGRIVRNDVITFPSQSVMPANCMPCISSADFRVTSYTAFDRGRLSAIEDLPATTEGAVPAQPAESVSTSRDGACLVTTSNRRVALLWDQRMPETSHDTRLRVQRIPGMLVDVVALVADMVVDTSLPPVAPLQRSIRTTMLLGVTGDCTALVARAREAQSFPSILADGIDHGASPDETYQLGDRGSTLTVAGHGAALPAGFVIEARMPGTRVQTNRPASDVVWHRDDTTGTFYLWFRTGLGSTETVTITSGC